MEASNAATAYSPGYF